MADVAASSTAPASSPSPAPPAAAAPATPAAGKKKGAKKTTPKTKKPSKTLPHPKASEMVIEAITNLRERHGSSLRAIKKYISQNFDVDIEKQATFIKKYLRTASKKTGAEIVQVKGSGAAGSFKLAAPAPPKESNRKQRVIPVPKKIEPKKPVAVKTLKKTVELKKASPVKAGKKVKKGAAVAKTSSPKKTVPAKKAAVASAKVVAKKVEKKAKSPKAKPKSPKPKKAAKKTVKK